MGEPVKILKLYINYLLNIKKIFYHLYFIKYNLKYYNFQLKIKFCKKKLLKNPVQINIVKMPKLY